MKLLNLNNKLFYLFQLKERSKMLKCRLLHPVKVILDIRAVRLLIEMQRNSYYQKTHNCKDKLKSTRNELNTTRTKKTSSFSSSSLYKTRASLLTRYMRKKASKTFLPPDSERSWLEKTKHSKSIKAVLCFPSTQMTAMSHYMWDLILLC